ncbi:hypothetical protein VTG60DRAFT_4197 [Thermothelomyces hinnuleus]
MSDFYCCLLLPFLLLQLLQKNLGLPWRRDSRLRLPRKQLSGDFWRLANNCRLPINYRDDAAPTTPIVSRLGVTCLHSTKTGRSHRPDSQILLQAPHAISCPFLIVHAVIRNPYSVLRTCASFPYLVVARPGMQGLLPGTFTNKYIHRMSLGSRKRQLICSVPTDPWLR